LNYKNPYQIRKSIYFSSTSPRQKLETENRKSLAWLAPWWTDHKDLRGLERETTARRTLRAGETNSASTDWDRAARRSNPRPTGRAGETKQLRRERDSYRTQALAQTGKARWQSQLGKWKASAQIERDGRGTPCRELEEELPAARPEREIFGGNQKPTLAARRTSGKMKSSLQPRKITLRPKKSNRGRACKLRSSRKGQKPEAKIGLRQNWEKRIDQHNSD
jgi:hypothetical protein